MFWYNLTPSSHSVYIQQNGRPFEWVKFFLYVRAALCPFPVVSESMWFKTKCCVCKDLHKVMKIIRITAAAAGVCSYILRFQVLSEKPHPKKKKRWTTDSSFSLPPSYPVVTEKKGEGLLTTLLRLPFFYSTLEKKKNTNTQSKWRLGVDFFFLQCGQNLL